MLKSARAGVMVVSAVALVLSGCTPEDSAARTDAAASASSVASAAVEGAEVAASASATSKPTSSETKASTKKASQDAKKAAQEAKKAAATKEADKQKDASTKKPAKGATSQRRLYRVIRVVDGDTVRVDINGGERVRVLGIDSPESVHPDKPVECGGTAASTAAHQLLDGQRVALVFDPTQARRDRFDRVLAYVEIPGVGDFGKIMLRQGHAREYTYAAPYRRQAAYRAAAQQARSGGRGVWGQCTQAQSSGSNAPAPAPAPTSASPTTQAPAPAPQPAPQPMPAP
ncbi:thermonuclease family protein, partial [Janibacter anophelis]|uniref:thermonuclease family protein n=1 Tax=Janibacter anophelis TaxID=319054 RepID=UPI001F07A583